MCDNMSEVSKSIPKTTPLDNAIANKLNANLGKFASMTYTSQFGEIHTTGGWLENIETNVLTIKSEYGLFRYLFEGESNVIQKIIVHGEIIYSKDSDLLRKKG
jgi:hypothetical protein